MNERERALAEFDRQHGLDKGVEITGISIPFWDLVSFMLKSYFAWLVASAMIGVIVGIVYFVVMMLTS